jgi:hypothetical protein
MQQKIWLLALEKLIDWCGGFHEFIEPCGPEMFNFIQTCLTFYSIQEFRVDFK